jgi:hypothetical protein
VGGKQMGMIGIVIWIIYSFSLAVIFELFYNTKIDKKEITFKRLLTIGFTSVFYPFIIMSGMLYLSCMLVINILIPAKDNI